MIRLSIDEVGNSTLEKLSAVDQLNRWMSESIRPYLKGSILETGSGIGNISSCLIADGIPLAVSDYSDHYCRLLEQKFAGNPLVKGIHQVDLADENFETDYSHLLGKYDSVYSLNVIEHIHSDGLAVANCKKLLAPGGHLVVLVPAYQTLYNSLDKELEHFRRYTRSSVKELFRSQGLEILNCWYFNLAGILGWFVAGSIMHKKALPGGSLVLYNKLAPLFRVADRITGNRVGLSVIIVGRKGNP